MILPYSINQSSVRRYSGGSYEPFASSLAAAWCRHRPGRS